MLGEGSIYSVYAKISENQRGSKMTTNSNVKLPVGTTVHRFLYDFVDGSGIFQESKSFTKLSAKVVLNNGKKVVLDDKSYTSLHIGEGVGLGIEEPLINIRVDDSTYGNTFTLVLYTTKDLTVEELSIIVEEAIQKKFNHWGDFYLSNVAEFLRTDLEVLDA